MNKETLFWLLVIIASTPMLLGLILSAVNVNGQRPAMYVWILAGYWFACFIGLAKDRIND